MHIVAAFSLDTWNLPHEVTIISLGAHGRPRTTLTFDLSQGPTAFLSHAALIRDEAEPGTAYIVNAAEAHAALVRLPDSRHIIDWFEQWHVLNVSLTPQTYTDITKRGHLSSQVLAVAAHQQLSATTDSGAADTAWPGPQSSFDDSLFSEANRKAAVQAATDGAQAVGNTVQQGFNSLLAHLAKAQLRAAMTPPEVRQPATQWADWARTVSNEWFTSPPAQDSNPAQAPDPVHERAHTQSGSSSWPSAGNSTTSTSVPESTGVSQSTSTAETSTSASAQTAAGAAAAASTPGDSATAAPSTPGGAAEEHPLNVQSTLTDASATQERACAKQPETISQGSGRARADQHTPGSQESTQAKASSDDAAAQHDDPTKKPSETGAGQQQDTISQAWQIVDDVTDWATTQRLTDTFWSFVGTLNNAPSGQNHNGQAEDSGSAWKNSQTRDKQHNTDDQ